MPSWILSGVAVLLLVLVPDTFGSNHFIYMTSYCSRTLSVNTSLSMALTAENNLKDDRNDLDFLHCALDIITLPGRKLFVHFMQLSIAPEIRHVDRVHLFDMEPEKKPITPPEGLYGKLERQLFIFDDKGVFIEDYTTTSKKLRIDFLGKPTVKNPGFRLLVTSVQDPDKNGNCPSRWLRCSHESMCVPPDASCDGLFNCGKDDLVDETGCEGDERVTNLLESYSLARDILIVILLPLAAFILIVVVMCLCYRRQLRRVQKKDAPPVMFSPAKGGRVEILQANREMTRLYAPPSYEDLFNTRSSLEPPPAYTSLTSLNASGGIVIENDSGRRRGSHRHGRSDRSGRNKGLSRYDSGSASSLESGDEPRVPMSQYERYRMHRSCPSDSENEDEEARQRRRRKGGGAKAKGKRRTDKACLDLHPVSKTSSPHGPSPLASPSTTSGRSVPSYNDSLSRSSKSPSSASSPEKSAAVIPTNTSQERSAHKSPARRSPDDCIPIHPKDSPIVPSGRQNCKNDSGNEADRRSDSESRSPSKRNSCTESLVSSAENVKAKSVEDLGDVAGEDIDEAKRKSRQGMGNGKTEAIVNGRC